MHKYKTTEIPKYAHAATPTDIQRVPSSLSAVWGRFGACQYVTLNPLVTQRMSSSEVNPGIHEHGLCRSFPFHHHILNYRFYNTRSLITQLQSTHRGKGI